MLVKSWMGFMMSQQQYMKNTKIIAVTWEGVSASAAGKTILSNCSGHCRSGEMLAIMGPSGAGKTTLLSLIAKRQSSSLKVQGEILANNETFSSKTFYKFGAFVYQNDLLFECLTVEETLSFAASLKIPDLAAAEEKVKSLIEEFQLQKCAQSYVGGILMKGISGGQKKRLCVAIEMVSDPSLLILDQPTSGLDSNKAARLLAILSKLALKGRTIIFTIHQPSYLQYSKLDRLVLLNHGETIYQGPAKGIKDYMISLGIEVLKTSTISDFFMGEVSQFKQQRFNYQTPLNVNNYSLRLASDCAKAITAIKQEDTDLGAFQDIYCASFLFSLRQIFLRDCANILRGGWKLKVTLMQTITKTLLAGLLFLNVIPSAAQLSNPLGYLLFIPAQNCAFNTSGANLMPSLISVALTIPVQRELYYKETDSKKYQPLPYFLSKVFIELLLVLFGTMIFTSIAFWMVGYTKTFSHFINYMIISILCAASGNSLGFFCATLFKSMERVATLTNIVLIPLLILSGIFNKLPSMPVWSSWLQYVSPFRYGTHLFLLNQYGDTTFGGYYDYQTDLGISFSYRDNFIILSGLALGFYTLSFFLLKFYATKIAP